MITLVSRLALALSALVVICSSTIPAAAGEVCCAPAAIVLVAAPVEYDAEPAGPSWIFRRSTFTNDPMTGARVAQYAQKDPVEPLEDQRAVTSVYRRTRSVNRGRDGSIDTSYQVQAWGNGRGGIDAEWQMFHDVWKESILSGGFYNSNTPFGPWSYGGGQPPFGYGGGYGHGGVPPHGYGGGYGGGYGWPGGYPGGPNGGWNPGQGPHGDKKWSDKDHWPSDDRGPLYQD